ncbi:MAG: acetate--CoA ligase family protein [Anaerolineales bacterium]|nr:acetate--CoA ligase family protein [Anaerolineales bacterium]
MDSSLQPFFRPQGVVMIGASTNPVKPGYIAARNLAQSGYPGAIHFVSQKPGELFGRPVYTCLAEVPDPVDLAVILVPAVAVLPAVEECGQRGIRAAIVLSAGFREVGAEGAALESELMQIARSHGIRIVGPNCVGFCDTHLPLDTSFLPPPPPKAGGVGVISQSGAMLAVINDWARTEGVGFSHLLSLGNKADVDEAEALEAVAADEHTRLVALYIEALEDGGRFLEAARAVARHKPLLALKVGRSNAGQRAAASHTGALAGSDSAYQAAFERTGVLRADTSQELFDWITAFDNCPLPAGPRVAILTNAGGPGVVAADAVEARGLQLAGLSESTRAGLAFLPPAASLGNPIDMLSSASPQDYARALGLLLDDPGVESIVVLLPAPPMFPAEDVADALLPVIQAARKPVVVNVLGGQMVTLAAERCREAGVAVYPFAEQAVSALSALTRRAEWLAAPGLVVPDLADVDRQAARRALQGAGTGAWLDPEAAERLVAAYGIPTAPVRLARSSAETASLAEELGFPLVVKLASPDIAHKSDVGGVLLGIDSPEAAAAAFREVTRRGAAGRPGAQIDGVHLQRMVPTGQEVIIGASRDPVFGPLMMFGSGGVEVEGLKDVAFALAPLDENEASGMLARTWAGRKLAGFRSIPPADAAAVREALVRLARLVGDHPEVQEIEINPLRVLAPGAGAVAVDVRVKC